MIFVDSNIPMYLVGGDHPNKGKAADLVERAALAGDPLVTDAEVLQEILHRYAAIRRHEAIQPAFDLLLGIVDEVFPIGLDQVRRGKEILVGLGILSARDALHAAVMEGQGISRIMTFDAEFDRIPGIVRFGWGSGPAAGGVVHDR